MPTGPHLPLAVALGYEAALRIGEAVNPSHYRYWHPTGTAATFGAAAAAGRISVSTAAQMLDALGSAGTQAAGLWEFNADGAMSKHLHPGKAAFNGMLAADLARKGFTGATRILEGDAGSFGRRAAAYDASRITDGLGERMEDRRKLLQAALVLRRTRTPPSMSRSDAARDTRLPGERCIASRRSRSRPTAPGSRS